MDEKHFSTAKAASSKDVLGFYDRYADEWDSRFGSARSVAAFHRIRLASFLRVARLKPAEQAMELGVGTGPYVDAIAPLVRRLVCVDGSVKMLERFRAEHQSLRNVTTLRLDLEEPICTDEEPVDVLYAFGLFEHIVDVNAFLRNCRVLLLPRGRLIIVGVNGRSWWYGWMRRLWRAGRHCSTDRYYTKEALDGLLTRHGFVPDSCHYWGYFPAGIGSFAYWPLRLIGAVVDRTPLRVYAGGLTASYVLVPDPADVP